MTVYSGTPAVIGTQYGDMTVRKAMIPGYCAEIGIGEVPDRYAYGETPSIAFQNLSKVIKAAKERAARKTSTKVLQFAKAA